MPSLLAFVNNFLSFFSSLSPLISCLNGIIDLLSYILILITLQEGWKFQPHIFFGPGFSHCWDTSLLCFPFHLNWTFWRITDEISRHGVCEARFLYPAFISCSWKLWWQRYPFRWKSFEWREVSNCSLFGSLPSLTFPTGGPELNVLAMRALPGS